MNLRVASFLTEFWESFCLSFSDGRVEFERGKKGKEGKRGG